MMPMMTAKSSARDRQRDAVIDGVDHADQHLAVHEAGERAVDEAGLLADGRSLAAR